MPSQVLQLFIYKSSYLFLMSVSYFTTLGCNFRHTVRLITAQSYAKVHSACLCMLDGIFPGKHTQECSTITVWSKCQTFLDGPGMKWPDVAWDSDQENWSELILVPFTPRLPHAISSIKWTWTPHSTLTWGLKFKWNASFKFCMRRVWQGDKELSAVKMVGVSEEQH